MTTPTPPPPISRSEFAARRARALAALGDGVMILPAGGLTVFANDTDNPFRGDADFLYLTGFPEPDAIAVLRPGHQQPFTLFVRPRNPEQEVWTGRRAGPEGAGRDYDADAAYPLELLGEKLPELIDGADTLYYAPWRDATLDATLRDMLATLRRGERFGRRAPAHIVWPGEVLHELRLVKSPAEIALTRHAAQITAAGHRAGLARCRPGAWEYQVQAAVEHAFREAGAGGTSFGTICAAGSSAVILHYIENTGQIGADDLVLLDAGAAYGGYCGDITRTFPASGRFTAPQRALYDVVRDALELAIAAVRPGITIDGIHEVAVRRLSAGLIDLGLLTGSVDEVIEKETYKRYYYHRTSHWLGIDVHDCGRYRHGGTPRPIAAGMVLTVEPGLYVAPDDATAPQGLRGVGVRLEDDVVVTAAGADVLTRDVPLDPDAIAALVGRG